MSNFIAYDSNNDNDNDNDKEQLNEIKNIRLTIDYFKELKEQELKLKEMKELKELKEMKELKEQELKLKELKELKEKNEKAINLIKSYINDYYKSYIHLVPSYSKITGYADNNDCLKELIKINNDELFNRLIKIDYEKSEVSFNYLYENDDYYKNTNNIIETHIYNNYDENNIYYNYSHYIYKNFKENIITNPLYQIIKEKLEFELYTIKNRTNEYNNKSKYFSRSLNDFINIYSNYYGYDKYYELYEDDIYYLYLKSVEKNNYYIEYYYNEFLIENKIIINNSNSNDIYNKHPYKSVCNNPSWSRNEYPSINIDYSYYLSTFYNKYCCHRDGCYLCRNTINTNDIGNSINVDCPYSSYNNICNINIRDNLLINYGSHGTTRINNFNINYYNRAYELDRNKGSRMIKHNLTNNIPSYIHHHRDDKYDELTIQNHYFIEKVFIDFPKIINYDEYEYIKVILSNIANIYDLPIIPPIKFI